MKTLKKAGTQINKVFEWFLTIAVVSMAVYCVWGAVSKENHDFYVFGYKQDNNPIYNVYLGNL